MFDCKGATALKSPLGTHHLQTLDPLWGKHWESLDFPGCVVQEGALADNATRPTGCTGALQAHVLADRSAFSFPRVQLITAKSTTLLSASTKAQFKQPK